MKLCVLTLLFLARWPHAQNIVPALLERSQALAPEGETVRTVFAGHVRSEAGSAAPGALVVSSAGGRTMSEADGSFWLEVELPLEAARVQVTAVLGSGTTSSVGSANVTLRSLGGVNPAGILTLAPSGSCQPSWLPTFGEYPGVYQDTVRALAVFDDGSGPALYVGERGIARWDGTSWSAVGDGLSGFPAPIGGPIVYALTVFDDGAGPALYAGGNWNRVAKWDGASWSAVGGVINDLVLALSGFDDGLGGGPALYAGGYFTTAGGGAASRIARWDGASWSALGSGMTAGGFGSFASVLALTVFDDGAGPALYAGGFFDTAGGVAATAIASWDGANWSALLGGVAGPVSALTVFDDGGGPALYAGGTFNNAGGVSANCIARWNGASWSPLGSGMGGGVPGYPTVVQALHVFDGGGAPALYAGGRFTTADGATANRIARWDGGSWLPPDSGVDGTDVFAFAVFDNGSGPALYAGGSFSSAGTAGASNLASWSGASWSTLGDGIGGPVLALAVFDDGGGPALYVGGALTSAGGLITNHIARWDGASWSPLASGLDDSVYALTVFDDGSGPALVAGGRFTTAGGVAASRVAKWNGTSWSALGSGMSHSSSGYTPDVRALGVFDDGMGAALYAGGSFTGAGGVAASHIAQWNGTAWSALGSGANAPVHALAVFDDGPGPPELYAGGMFWNIGGVTSHIAKWNGASWSAVGAGLSGFAVDALAVFDDGGGPALIAGGSLSGNYYQNIAKWTGSGLNPQWTSVGSGTNGTVEALAVFDDGSGSGPVLYVCGGFNNAGGMAVMGAARWDGASWSPLESGLERSGHALAVFDDGSGAGPALFAGGTFYDAPDSGDNFLARWQGCDSIAPTLACPTSVLVRDPLSGPAGEFVTFALTASDNFDPAPAVVCVPPSGSFFSAGVTLVTCTATDVSGNEATCAFPVIVNRKVRAK